MKPTFASLLLLIAAAASAQNGADVDPAVIQRAGDGAVQLRSMMKDPKSFVLEQVYQLKPDKKGRYEICYFYNARNSFGGYGNNGEALLLKNGTIYDIDEKTRSNPFFGAFDSCRPGNRTAEITADVEGFLDPSKIRSKQILSPADRPKMVAAENAGFKKEGVAGYAE